MSKSPKLKTQMKNLNCKINKLFGTCVPNLPRYYDNKKTKCKLPQDPAFSNALDLQANKREVFESFGSLGVS
jgi:hypothetical protein